MSSFWKDRNVFVTGCTGLLGTHLVEELLNRGACVTGLIRDHVPRSRLNRPQTLAGINLVHGSLENYSLIERALNEYEIETVFHLGAQTIVSIANRNPLSTFETNIKGSWNVLEACRRSPLVKRIVFASSDKAYGTQADLPYVETARLQGTHPYDVSKSCADLLCRAYFTTYRLPVCITRCGNLYGAGDLNFNRLVPGTIRSLIRKEPPVIRSDGSYIRDYFYVLDAVSAYLMLAEQMDDRNIHGEAFNFSNEIQVSVLELTQKIIRLMDLEAAPVILNQAVGEIKHQYLSAEKAGKVLNWKPKYTLDQGLQETIKWYRELLSEGS